MIFEHKFWTHFLHGWRGSLFSFFFLNETEPIVTCAEVSLYILFGKTKSDVERESKTKWKTWYSVGETGREKVGGSGDSVRKSEERQKQREKVGGKAETAWESRRKGGDSVSKSLERRRQREKVDGTVEREWDSWRKSRQRSCGVIEALWEAITVREHTCDSDDSGGDRIQWKRVDDNDNQPTGSRSATLF